MGEIADVIGGGTPRTNDPDNYEGGTIPWITPADLSGYTAKHIARGERSITEKGLNNSSARMMPAGAVLFSSRAPVGYVAIASNPVCTNQGFKSFVLKSGDILSDYVYWWLKGSKDLAESLASGTTFLELSGAKTKRIPIPVAPLEQQKLIVAEIEKQFSCLDEAVASLKRTKANLKRYKAAVLKAAVEGKLTEDWRKQHPHVEPASKLLEHILIERRAKWNGRGKYKEPAKPDTSNILSLPKHWTFAAVDSFLVEPMCNGISVKGSMTPPGVPALRLNAMTETGFDYSEVRYIPIDAALAKELEVKTGDFFVSRGSGSLRLVGRGTVAQTPPRQCVFPDTMIRLRIAVAMGASRWISTIWSAELIRRQIEKRVKTTAGIWKISQPELGSILLPVPPEAEQHRIVAEVERRLSVIEELEAVVGANLTRADRLRQAILTRAFAGKLASPALKKTPDASCDFSMAAESPSTYGAAR
jgi:type I restriction enzyme S subunit